MSPIDPTGGRSLRPWAGRCGTPRVGRPAFSLLELLIVLAIMVSLAAITFPRLTRPLAESEVQRAAQLLRDQIADCRQAALVSGEPMFVRLETGSGEVSWGGWVGLLAEDRDGNGLQADPATSATDSGPAADSGGQGTTRPVTRRFSLPPGFVVSDVRRGQAADLEADGGSAAVAASGADPVGRQSGFELGGPRPSSDPAGPLSPAVVPADGQRRYLPFLPSGVGQDATVVIVDTLDGSRAALEIDAVTGMTRIGRLPAIATESLPPAEPSG